VKHELLVDLVRKHPDKVPALLAECLRLDLPAYAEVTVQSPDLNDSRPAIYHADAVLTLTDGRKPILAIVAEAQLGDDNRKRLTWPVYLAMVRHRLDCPAILLVLCPTPTIAKWCGTPIDMGHPGWVLVPLVIGPEQIPQVTEPKKVAAFPELGVLSALAHGSGPRGGKIAQALLEGLYQAGRHSDESTRELYAHYMDSVLGELPSLVRKQMETQMATKMEYHSAFARSYHSEGKIEGKIEGKVESILEVLSARGLTVPEEAREQILSCHDIHKLNTWLRRAATVTTIEDLFA